MNKEEEGCPTLDIMITKPGIPLPKRMSSGAAGFDFVSPEDCTIKPCEIKKIDLGFRCAIHEDYYCRIEVRSSLGIQGLQTVSGIIDSDYRGEWKLCVTNISQKPIEIKKNHRIGQLLINRRFKVKINCVDKLNETVRGEGGFGHTGKV
jgi:dUTP pyrophosphatase